MGPLVQALGLLGLGVGLFLNVVIDRVPARQPLLPLRWRCGRCPEEAEDRPGLPVGAWLRPGAACPVCKNPIEARYLLVPLATAGLFAVVSARLGRDWALPAYLVFTASAVLVSVIDLRLHIIPNRVVYPTIFLSVPLLLAAALLQGDFRPFGRALVGASLAFGGLFLVHMASPAGMGFGDVRLSFVLGLFLGWESLGLVLSGLFLGFALCAVIGIVLVALRVRDRKWKVPFGPFLVAGALMAILGIGTGAVI